MPTISARRLALTNALLEGGRGTELDTSRAEAQLNSTLASIPPLETAVKQAMYRLGVLVGQQPTALEPELSEPVPLPALPTFVALGKPEDLLRRRPDIRATERNLAAATARVGVATADLFPRVTLAGSVALEATSSGGSAAGAAATRSPSVRVSSGRPLTWAGSGSRSEWLMRAPRRRWRNTSSASCSRSKRRKTRLVAFTRQRARRDLLWASAQASEKAQQLGAREVSVWGGGLSDGPRRRTYPPGRPGSSRRQ